MSNGDRGTLTFNTGFENAFFHSVGKNAFLMLCSNTLARVSDNVAINNFIIDDGSKSGSVEGAPDNVANISCLTLLQSACDN